MNLYLVPIEVVDTGPGTNARGPKYFPWRLDPDPPALVQSVTRTGMMDYGFANYELLAAISARAQEANVRYDN